MYSTFRVLRLGAFVLCQTGRVNKPWLLCVLLAVVRVVFCYMVKNVEIAGPLKFVMATYFTFLLLLPSIAGISYVGEAPVLEKQKDESSILVLPRGTYLKVECTFVY